MTDLSNQSDWAKESLRALSFYGIFSASLSKINEGLINLTVEVLASTGQRYILQRVNEIFDPSVNLKIDKVTGHLARGGILCPQMVRTTADEIYLEIDDKFWRLFVYIPGYSKVAFTSREESCSAGYILGKFHRGLENFDDQVLASERRHIHDLQLHLGHLEKTLSISGSHYLYSDCCAVEEKIQNLYANIPKFALGPLVVAHGDPKASNILFSKELDEALCLIDLDTVGLMPVVFELGDAMRSWCNPFPEDSPHSRFSFEMYEAAMQGYKKGWGGFNFGDSILPATMQVYVELAARFLADVVNESYFGWDRTKYKSAAAHNLARAKAQILAAESLALLI